MCYISIVFVLVIINKHNIDIPHYEIIFNEIQFNRSIAISQVYL